MVDHTYHGEHNHIVIRAQPTGGSQPRHQARYDKHKGGEGKQDRDDKEAGTPTIELRGSALDGRHVVVRWLETRRRWTLGCAAE